MWTGDQHTQRREREDQHLLILDEAWPYLMQLLADGQTLFVGKPHSARALCENASILVRAADLVSAYQPPARQWPRPRPAKIAPSPPLSLAFRRAT